MKGAASKTWTDWTKDPHIVTWFCVEPQRDIQGTTYFSNSIELTVPMVASSLNHGLYVIMSLCGPRLPNWSKETADGTGEHVCMQVKNQRNFVPSAVEERKFRF